MRRWRSILALSVPSLLGAGYFGAGLGACRLGEVVDLGADLDAGVPEVESAPESGLERDASVADRADSSPAEDATDAADEGPLPPGFICISDYSFERHLPGDAQVLQPLQPMPPGWSVCSGATAGSSSCGLAPTDGDSYVGLSVGLGLTPLLNNTASISTRLCASLEAGTTYALTVDYGLDTPVADAESAGEPPALQIWGGTSLCQRKEQLWRSASLPNACMWRTTCQPFKPSADYTYITLFPETSSASALSATPTYVIVDHLVASPTCPSLLDGSATTDSAPSGEGG